MNSHQKMTSHAVLWGTLALLLQRTQGTALESRREGAVGVARKEQPPPQLGTHVAALEEMLATNAGKPHRERLTFMRMFEELRLSGYAGGYDAVRRYARAWERQQGIRV